MKTRREFFKTLAGSMAVVAACVVAPKSLIAREDKLPVEERLDNIDSWITVTDTDEGISRRHNPHGKNYLMQFNNRTGWRTHKGS